MNSALQPIGLSISFDSNDPTDLVLQKELVDVASRFARYYPEIQAVPENGEPRGAVSKQSDIELVISSVRVVIPVAAVAPVLIAWIREYYATKSRRSIRIQRDDGISVVITAYEPDQTLKALDVLISTTPTSALPPNRVSVAKNMEP